jgi:hypothetical protein
VSGQLRAPVALPPGKDWYPLDRRLGEPQSHSGRGGEEKNSQPPPGIEHYDPDRPARSLVARLTKQHAMEAYWGVEVDLHAFFTSEIDGS